MPLLARLVLYRLVVYLENCFNHRPMSPPCETNHTTCRDEEVVVTRLQTPRPCETILHQRRPYAPEPLGAPTPEQETVPRVVALEPLMVWPSVTHTGILLDVIA